MLIRVFTTDFRRGAVNFHHGVHLIVPYLHLLRVAHETGGRLYGYLHGVRSDRSQRGRYGYVHLGREQPDGLRRISGEDHAPLVLQLLGVNRRTLQGVRALLVEEPRGGIPHQSGRSQDVEAPGGSRNRINPRAVRPRRLLHLLIESGIRQRTDREGDDGGPVLQGRQGQLPHGGRGGRLYQIIGLQRQQLLQRAASRADQSVLRQFVHDALGLRCRARIYADQHVVGQYSPDNRLRYDIGQSSATYNNQSVHPAKLLQKK